nr:MAG TPA: hypothetical protein [Caudoviricetes sp.]
MCVHRLSKPINLEFRLVISNLPNNILLWCYWDIYFLLRFYGVRHLTRLEEIETKFAKS